MATNKPPVTSADIRKLLHERYSDRRRYAYAEEVGNSTGLEQTRRLDMVVVDCYKSNGFAFEGIEIKISKSDLRRELQDSSKHNIFYPNLDYYSLAAPAGIVDIDLAPKHWGLYFVDVAEDGAMSMRTYRKPCSLHDEFISNLDKGFIAALLRSMWGTRPTDSMLSAARKEGYEAALIESETVDYKRYVEQLMEENKSLRKLPERLGIWSGSDVERAIQDYEAFKNLKLNNLKWALERVLAYNNDLQQALDLLNGKEVT